MDQLKRLKDARMWLTARMPFVGYIALQFTFHLAGPERIDTIGVALDGTITANEEFLAKLTDPEIRFVVAHEVLHPALEFWSRLGGRDKTLFNYAHDYVINLILQDFARTLGSTFKICDGVLLDNKYQGMSAEIVYKELEKSSNKLQCLIIGTDCISGKAKSAEGQRADRGDSGAQRELNNRWKNVITAAAQIHEAQKGTTTLPDVLKQLLDEIKTPKVTWQNVLSQWIGENAGSPDRSYMRPSRRSEAAGTLLQGKINGSLPDVTILWDTSGSMNGLAPDIFAEVAAITSELGLTVRLIVCDMVIHADVVGIDSPDDVIPHIKGGGGSDFNPAFELLRTESNTSIVVAFTDGMISVPSTQPETLGGVLWVLIGGAVRPADWGAAIKITDDGFAEVR